MNGVLANGEGEFPDQLVKNHHDTRFIAAANTVGRGATAQYVGRNPLDGATIDRFAFLPWNVDWGLTEALMSGRESSTTTPARIMQDERDRITPSDWLLKVRAYSEASQRLGIKHLVTPRAALLGRKLIEAGMGEYWSTEMLLHKGLNDDNRRKLARAVSGSGAV
jgi:cobaltochelatase CobS